MIGFKHHNRSYGLYTSYKYWNRVLIDIEGKKE